MKKVSKKTQNKKKSFPYLFSITAIKIVLIIFIIYGLYEYEIPFSNTVSLLSVVEGENGDIIAGSTIDLNLMIKPGSGQVFVKLNTVEEIDTQISIMNSQKIACNLFKLDCQNYDFFYEFDSSSLILKGPSASSAIAILTAKTMNREKIHTDEVAITGSLNSGGLVGVVGGVDKKVETAKNYGFEKVLIPVFSTFNDSVNYSDIEVIKTIDIVEAYNEFNGDKYKLDLSRPTPTEGYESLMKELAVDLCERTESLKLEIDYSKIEENSSSDTLNKGGENSLNSSKISYENENYYSQGSFCYSGNLNFRNLIEKQKNLSLKIRNENIKSLKEKIEFKIEEITNLEFKENIQTINDFYVYLILLDRVFESKEHIDRAIEIEVNEEDFSFTKELINTTTNETYNETIFLNESQIRTIKENVQIQKETLFSYAFERFYTVNLWEKFITHSGSKIKFTDSEIKQVCAKINRDLSIKNELLKNYNLNFLNDLIQTQQEFMNPGKNKYLCVYKGLEMDGRINTILNSVGVSSDEEKEHIEKMVELTKSRINLNAKGDFQFIPTMYSEYSQELLKQGDLTASMLYSNYAMTYADLNLYLEKEDLTNSIIETTLNKLFENILFVIAILVILAFLN